MPISSKLSRRLGARVSAAFLALSLAACATTGEQAATAPAPSGNGVVMSIAESEVGSTTGRVVGAIGGAVIGSMLGSKIGAGSGRTAASLAASIGGSMAGSALGSRALADHYWDVSVRFADGVDREMRVKDRPNYGPGDKVSVHDGRIIRR